MTTHARWWGIGVIVAALVAWFAGTIGTGSAADEGSEPREAIIKVADALEQGDDAAAKKEAAALKEAELEDIMPLLSLRGKKSKGLGLGEKPGVITPDGIEKKIEKLGKTALTNSQVSAQAKAIEKAAYICAAIADVIPDKCPVTVKTGTKDPADWKTWSEDMKKAAVELAEATKAKDPKQILKASDRLDASCKKCHDVFKD